MKASGRKWHELEAQRRLTAHITTVEY